jgi:hypothetical protein
MIHFNFIRCFHGFKSGLALFCIGYVSVYPLSAEVSALKKSNVVVIRDEIFTTAGCDITDHRNILATDTLIVVQANKPEIRIVPDHPWLPPFGPDRVGRPLLVEVKLPATNDTEIEYWLAGYLDGREIQRESFEKVTKSSAGKKVNVAFSVWPEEVALLAKSSSNEKEHRVTTLMVNVPMLEADAEVRSAKDIHPVDLGTILVPQNWLLLPGGEAAEIEVAALSHSGNLKNTKVVVWFESSPQKRKSTALPLGRNRRLQVKVVLNGSSTKLERDILHVSILDGTDRELWRKEIPVMLVQNPPDFPRFGATEIKLRYDAPISVRAKDSTFSSLDFKHGWDEQLKDVVVSLPNGSRFVFWRGSGYVPFWASKNNTGITYEWAETARKDAVDCVEPLMDKELRYGRVRIIESTTARVHVRWTYQACDFDYKVWGDKVFEDFYFYPDGFGSRVLTLQSEPERKYELSEFIIITPQDAVPFSMLPSNLLQILFPDGEKREITFPYSIKEQGEKMKSRGLPAVFRARLHKDESCTAIYFNPYDSLLPKHIYAPFYDSGQIVTPCYWGSHWPLSRGQTTCWAISNLVHATPAANSVITWDLQQSLPLRDASFRTLDALGRSGLMRERVWEWLIGYTDMPNEQLLGWAQSFSAPPSVSDLKGAQPADEPYIPERRAMSLQAEASSIELTLTPGKICINPVIEITGWTGKTLEVWINNKKLALKDYAWDRRVLWINATFKEAIRLKIGIIKK